MARQNYLQKEDFFMSIACLAAQRSKDNRTQVGAVIVAPDDRILSIGYNGTPIGVHDNDMEWTNDKYFCVCYAVMNAVVLGCKSLTGGVQNCTLYTTLFPSKECTKIIIQAGIKEVYYLEQKPESLLEDERLKKLMRHVKIVVEKFELNNDSCVFKMQYIFNNAAMMSTTP